MFESGAGIVMDSVPTNRILGKPSKKAGALFSALQAAKRNNSK